MLIQKGKFLKFISLSGLLDAAGIAPVLLLFVLAWLGPARLQAAPAQQAQPSAGPARQATGPARQAAPHAVAIEFYGWYLETLSADQDPLSDRHAVFGNYVAQDLVARLVERLRRKRAPATDYFLQSPGYQTAWRRNVAAVTVSQRASAADVIVTLGHEESPKRVLALSMVLEGGAWKIRQVALAEARSSKSSTEQPVI